MNGHVVLSHGMESGPQATKVSAMAEVAESLGWRTTRPDFRDLDVTGNPARIDDRIDRICTVARSDERLVLAGSSMGAFASGLASLRVRCAGLYLLAPPMVIPGYGQHFGCAAVPTAIVHGWHDELIPAVEVVAFARARSLPITLVDDSHRLSEHVEVIAEWFGLFLRRLA
jgi:predicted alpha/beta-hydrolase family hydrolase